ncbi:quinon protein alcohol dehydrogenase-like superfamily [Entophlyctis helioformis]|nr:quinon protein alcohol dehydrogenase-like superfamily [Entophlyctis helioformis]
MRSDFKFSNLCGTVYKTGNVLFTPDGNSLISPVGNRVTVFDLVNNKSFTMPFENRKDIVRMALSPNAALLITIDEDGRALLVNFPKQVVLHHHSFKAPVKDIAFSPDGRFIAVSHEKQVHIWKAPGFTLEFAPFVLHRVLTGHYDAVTSVSWSSDSKFLVTGSRDMTCRVYSMSLDNRFPGAVLTGHNDVVVGAWFAKDLASIYTVGRDGALYQWSINNNGSWAVDDAQEEEQQEEEEEEEEETGRGPRKQTSAVKRRKGDEGKKIRVQRWRSEKRHYFNQNHAKIVSATFHAPSGLLSVGFDSGVFGIWELPDFTNIHTLSISHKKINTVAVNASGEWLAFGCSALGQLLVWEWQSESYVLKQQGHDHDMNCLTYSPDGQFIATGGDDAKVKLWNTQTGFCFVTFTEHSGGISAIEFARRGQVVFSASLDGTVRAFDLVRYRNFRTFTSPTPAQFSCLAVDPSGEIVCAGSFDTFEIFVWSVQTGRLLDILPGHEGPVSSLAFSPTDGFLTSASWDKTVRTWDVFGRDKQADSFDHLSEVLTIAFAPDGKHFAATTLSGQICFWNLGLGKQVATIEGRKDISGGRSVADRVTADNSSADKSFTSLCYTPDGAAVIAGGNSKYVCIYDVVSRSLIKKFQISHNLSLDRMLERLNSSNMTEAGPMGLIDQSGDASDLEDRMDKSLPGVQSGDRSLRKTRPQARTKDVRFAPTARSWAAATTEGLLIYSLDERLAFDPFDLDMDITPDSVRETLASQEYLRALVMAFRLGEADLVAHVAAAIPFADVALVFGLEWVTAVARFHGRLLRDRHTEHAAALRAVSKILTRNYEDLGRVCADNKYLVAYLVDRAADAGSKDGVDAGADEGMDVDGVDMADMGL